MPRLAIAFFCSGFGALLCQIVWQRMLGIFAGSDTISAALVVAAFLAGLGLGSIIGAKVADRLSPYRAMIGFALAEGGVALFALVSKFFLYDFLAMDLAGVVDDPIAIFALCFAGLVLPTTLMGASLPLLARAIADRLDTVAERISSLYGLNTLGAGLGALLGGWFIVGNLGFVGALVLAAGLDLVAAVLARHFPGVIGLVLGDTPLAMAKQRAATAILRLGLDDGEIRRHAAITRDGFGVVPGGNEERIYYDLPLLQPAPVLLLHAALPFGSKRVDERVPSCIDSMDLAVMAKFGAGKVTCQALEGTSHILFNEAPEAAATAIREWLAQQARR